LALFLTRPSGSPKAPAPSNPAELFDAFAYPGRPTLRGELAAQFKVVATPFTPLGQELREGDLLLRRAEGAMGHLSVIAASELRSYEQVLWEGLVPEAAAAGHYAQVVEAGARPHGLADRFARRVTDADGRLPGDSLVLRVRQPDALVQARADTEAAGQEVCAGDVSDFGSAWRSSRD